MIDLTNPEVVDLIRQLRSVVQKLAVKSHAPSQGFNPAPPVDPKPRRERLTDYRPPVPHLGAHHSKAGADSSIPRGAIDRKGDLTPEFRQKSAEYFQRRLNYWVRARGVYGPAELRALLTEAQEVLRDWMRTPLVDTTSEAAPDRGSFLWKCQIADDDRPIYKVKQEYTISTATIYRYRAKYRGLRRVVKETA